MTGKNQGVPAESHAVFVFFRFQILFYKHSYKTPIKKIYDTVTKKLFACRNFTVIIYNYTRFPSKRQ